MKFIANDLNEVENFDHPNLVDIEETNFGQVTYLGRI